jgi:starch synthase (maltosyl-transferring)
VVLSVGRLDPQKGLLTLLAAAPDLVSQFPDVHFLIVGEGPQRSELERTIQHKNLAGRVHLAGWRSDVPQLMGAAFCLALPSIWEGMPNVVLEAMAAGLPIVCSNVEGSEELVISGQTGLVFASGAPDELASSLRTLLADGAYASAMGRAAQERVRREFSWERMVAAYEDLYMRLVASRAR